MDCSITNWITTNQAIIGFIGAIASVIGVIICILQLNKYKANKMLGKLFEEYDYKFRPIHSIEELLDKALTEIELISKTDYNQIILSLTEKYSAHLHVVADAIPANKQRYEIVANAGLIGEAYNTGDTILVNDISKIKDYFNAVSETKSEICVPIKFDNLTIGVINSESESIDHFSEDLRNSFEGIATALAKNLLKLGWKKKAVNNGLVRLKRVPLNK